MSYRYCCTKCLICICPICYLSGSSRKPWPTLSCPDGPSATWTPCESRWSSRSSVDVPCVVLSPRTRICWLRMLSLIEHVPLCPPALQVPRRHSGRPAGLWQRLHHLPWGNGHGGQEAALQSHLPLQVRVRVHHSLLDSRTCRVGSAPSAWRCQPCGRFIFDTRINTHNWLQTIKTLELLLITTVHWTTTLNFSLRALFGERH